jgi:hypothetical protein
MTFEHLLLLITAGAVIAAGTGFVVLALTLVGGMVRASGRRSPARARARARRS